MRVSWRFSILSGLADRWSLHAQYADYSAELARFEAFDQAIAAMERLAAHLKSKENRAYCRAYLEGCRAGRALTSFGGPEAEHALRSALEFLSDVGVRRYYPTAPPPSPGIMDAIDSILRPRRTPDGFIVDERKTKRLHDSLWLASVFLKTKVAMSADDVHQADYARIEESLRDDLAWLHSYISQDELAAWVWAVCSISLHSYNRNYRAVLAVAAEANTLAFPDYVREIGGASLALLPETIARIELGEGGDDRRDWSRMRDALAERFRSRASTLGPYDALRAFNDELVYLAMTDVAISLAEYDRGHIDALRRARTSLAAVHAANRVRLRGSDSDLSRLGSSFVFSETALEWMQDAIIERAADLEPAEAVAISESGKAATLVMTGQLDSEGSAEVNVPIDVLRLRTALNVARLFDWTSESRLNAWVHGSRRRGT